jgi:hypothetical protein
LAVNRAPRSPAEFDAATLGGCKSRLGASRDHAGFHLGHRCHLLEQEFACSALDHGEIGKPHINARWGGLGWLDFSSPMLNKRSGLGLMLPV